MRSEKYLAFDLGASSGRAMLGVWTNEKLHLEEIHRFPNRMINCLGRFQWDILHLYDEIKTALIKTAAAGHTDIRSIGIDTWGVDFGLIGRGETLLGNPYAYRDMDESWMQKVMEIIPPNKLYDMTGIQFMPFNTLFQLYRLAKENSPLLQVAERLLFTPDLINFFLTGERVSEYTIASTSQLLDPWSKTWQKELFKELELPIELMADIVPPGSNIGRLRKQIAKETGLPQVNVVAPASHDTASAVAAVPVEGNNWAYLSSGTWSLLGVEVDKPIINDRALKSNFTNEGGVHNKIRFLKNVAGLWLIQRCKADWAKLGKDYSYTALTKMAEEAGPTKCYIDPDDSRFNNPIDMPEAIADYCRETNQPVPATEGEYVRCALESLARKYKQVLEDLNTLLPQPVQKLHIVGGGSKNTLLNRLTEEYTGVKVVAGPVEATAIGNLMIQRQCMQQL